MNKITGSLALTLLALRAPADVFVAPSNEVAFLTVPTNQTMLISSVKLGSFDGSSSGSLQGWIVQNGITNTLSLTDQTGSAAKSSGPFAIEGPCQIAFQAGVIGDSYQPAPVVVSYTLLRNSLLHSTLVAPGSTNQISVPAGKSVRFLAFTSDGMDYDVFSFQNGTNTVFDVRVNSGDEFAGPLTVTVKNPAWSSYSELVSYYFTDDFFAVPDTGFISGPTGSFEIAVEKSADLNAWVPVVVYDTASDQKAFYRLRIQK